MPGVTSPLRKGRSLSGEGAACAGTTSSSRVGLRHIVERRSRRDELFLLGALLELPDNSLRVLHHPPAHIALADGLSFLRVLHQVRDPGKAERQFRVVKVLLALEV